MHFRYDSALAIRSWIVPALIYLSIVAIIVGFLFPKFFLLHYDALLVLSIFAFWRYGWMIFNYIRAFIYAKLVYPKRKREVQNLHESIKYPKKLYFLIPSYQEDEWVSVETFNSIFSQIGSIPSEVVLVVSTASKKEDELIQRIFDSYKYDKSVTLIFQRQSNGKRIAMGHALRAISRDYHESKEDINSVTIFMDGDSYLENRFLERLLPFFAHDPKLGALTTNELAYINSKNRWYKDWFNLKFGQRHILFQAHSLSKKVMTLTGRLSAYRTNIVIQEDFINLVENDTIISPIHGKFRFLMGDDKSTWFYLLKSGWDMIYVPDLLCISLESRDGDFLNVSKSLIYRWFGNTLRNNTRALKLKPWRIGWYIWYAILEQRLNMWTSLVGISSAIALSIFSTWYYLFFFIAWVLVVRVIQLLVISLGGHKVSWRMPLLLLYTQWVGAFIKIKAYYNLSDQSWSKNGKKHRLDDSVAHISHPLVPIIPKIMMITSTTLFVTTILLAHNILKVPNRDFLPSLSASELKASTIKVESSCVKVDLLKEGVSKNSKNNAKIINQIISNYKEDKQLILTLPEGEIPLYHPIVIDKSNVTLQGVGKNKTKLISYIKNSDDQSSVILIKGEVLKHIGNISNNLYKNQSFFRLKFLKGREKYLLIREPNDEQFLKQLGSKKWHKRYPYLRQEIVKVIDYDDLTKRVDIENALLTDFYAKKSEVISLDMVENVVVKDLTIKQIFDKHNINDYRFVYKNISKDLMVNALSLEYASNCSIKSVRFLQSGSHAISCNFSYGIDINNIYVDGSWNKGKKGNGYVRFARTFHSKFYHSIVKNMRHVTLQWSSCGNSLKDLYLQVDINLHGGFAHDNYISNITFSLPKQHKWKAIFITPLNASWAPPDGDNYVDYKSIKFKKWSQK